MALQTHNLNQNQNRYHLSFIAIDVLNHKSNPFHYQNNLQKQLPKLIIVIIMIKPRILSSYLFYRDLIPIFWFVSEPILF